MMMRTLRETFFALAATAALAVAPATAAAQLAPAGIGPQEPVTLEASSGVVDDFPGGPNFLVGPYTGTIGGTNVTLYCVDFLNSVSSGASWTANIGLLTTGGMETTRIGMELGPSGYDEALDRYSRAAWLASQFAGNTGRANWSGIHAAIWRIAVPGGDPADGYVWSGEGQSWYEMAMDDAVLAGFDARRWRVVTDVAADGFEGGKQEYLVQVVPEPGAVVLVGAGLGALLLVGYRRRI